MLVFGQNRVVRLHAVFGEELLVHIGGDVEQRIAKAQQNALSVEN